MPVWGSRLRARLLGALVMLVGLADVLAAMGRGLAPPVVALKHAFTPFGTAVATGTAAMLGLLLILLGRAIASGRRLAYQVALTALALSTAAQIAKGFGLEAAAPSALLGAALVRYRGDFPVRPGPIRVRTLQRVVPRFVAVFLAYGGIGLYTHAGASTPELTAARGIGEIGARAVGLTGPVRFSGSFGHWFPASITVLGVVTLMLLTVLAFAPYIERHGGDNDERDLVRSLIDRADGDSLDPFLLRKDRSYVFSPDGRAAVGYRYMTGVGLAGGEPVGDPASASEAVRMFLALCGQRGWRPAVLGVREDRLHLYPALHAIYVGDEAQVDVASFSLSGRHMRNARQAVSRARNFGVTREVFAEADLDPALRGKLLALAERSPGGGADRDGFSMTLELTLDNSIPGCVLSLCRDATGRLIAFQHYVPYAAGRGLSLDVMRRERGSPNGVHESMIVSALEWAADHGIETMSLNFAAFRRLLDATPDRTKLQAATAYVIKLLDPLIQGESLARFNGKFDPRWVPRYVVYRSPADLGAIGVAAIATEFTLPALGGRIRRRADRTIDLTEPERERVG